MFFMETYQCKKENIESVELHEAWMEKHSARCLLPYIAVNNRSFESNEGYHAIDELLRIGYYGRKQHKRVYARYKSMMSNLDVIKINGVKS